MYKSAIIAISVAVVWAIAFRSNFILFSWFAECSSWSSLIFIPAAVRLISVLVFRWTAVVGLLLGSVATGNLHGPLVPMISLAAVSAIAPMLAVHVSRELKLINLNLSGLTAVQLLCCSGVSAACNAVMATLALTQFEHIADPVDFAERMFIGDVFGIVLVLYSISIVTKVVKMYTNKTKKQLENRLVFG